MSGRIVFDPNVLAGTQKARLNQLDWLTCILKSAIERQLTGHRNVLASQGSSSGQLSISVDQVDSIARFPSTHPESRERVSRHAANVSATNEGVNRELKSSAS